MLRGLSEEVFRGVGEAPGRYFYIERSLPVLTVGKIREDHGGWAVGIEDEKSISVYLRNRVSFLPGRRRRVMYASVSL
ncbi:hypothetical protein HYALB_00002819 [Hymenoscyphus albidus]|uniref:Uncharacterized protein n=1 Tax=Hymenoscyphus albidus TaxID=595503 RepID=A0A9N9LJI2_9HELO|nr:hypothetical protein HYALB_00002819 [Hymenoscyphus albidus]